MGSISTYLINAANTLKVFQSALDVAQNNIMNANSPGYARQTPNLMSTSFDLLSGAPGGVRLGTTQDSRNQFAEQGVRARQAQYSYHQQKVADLSTAENYFSMSADSGIAPSMSALFQSFSQLSVTPNDVVARQTVLNNAVTVAQNFNQTANGILSQRNDLIQATASTINTINQLASTIAQINAQDPVNVIGAVNPGVDAQLNAALDQLSQYVNFTTLRESNGTLSVFIGGQTPLVINQESYAIQGDFSAPQAAILSSSLKDITGQITGGKLGGELEDNNVVLPSYVTSLDTLAETLATQVNSVLNNGIDQNGASPVTNLFGYDPNSPAQSLVVNPLTPDQIAAALPGAPGGNGNALALAALANTHAIDGYTFAQAYGNLGGQVGNDLSTAQSYSATDEALLSQAETLRQQASGVSLDSEALNLMQFQRSYDAISKMIGVLSSLSLNVINLLPPISSS